MKYSLPLKGNLSKCQSALLKEIYEDLDILEDIYSIIHDGIIEDPPISIREGNIIKNGFNDQVDEYRSIAKSTKEWIARIEDEERTKNGIKNPKSRV